MSEVTTQTESLRLTTEQVEAISRAVAEPRRFAMLRQIGAGEEGTLCACLEAKDCLSPATISHHLKELTEAGLIEVQREGRNARLRLRREVWQAYLEQLATL